MHDGGVAIGLSLSGPRQKDTLRKALGVTVDGVNPFSCVQATFNILEPSAGSALDDAHAAGWGVIVKEALANGRLAPQLNHEVSAGARAVLDDVARRRGVSVDAIALSWVLSHDFVDIALSGAVTTEQLHSNIAALDVAVNDEERDVLSSAAEPSDVYWKHRRALAWS
jgi:aryl-alcohol dehydrogenase-like predicted oxidoreductase